MTTVLRKLLAIMALTVAVFGFATPAHAAWNPRVLLTPLWWLHPAESKPLIQPEPKKAIEPQTSPTSEPVSNRFIEQVKAEENNVEETKERKVVAGWLTPWGSDSYESFKNNLHILTEVHPFVYTIGADGVTVVPDQGEWHKEEVLRLSRKNGIKVLPTISGDVHYSDLMLNDPAKRTAHINEIMKVIQANNYDGFNIDYEGFLNGYNRDVYAAFMEEISQRLHAEGKLVAISVEAFNRKQDWDRIGKVVDRFMLMGYDYNAARGPQVGPIGPASWLKEVVEYTQTRVPKEKIVLGLGSYGYSWYSTGTQYASTAVSYQDALNIAQETGATIQRQDDAPYFNYNRGAGPRHLYFEDAVSTAPKLDLIENSGIAGVAFWRLGTEDPKIWQEVAQRIDRALAQQ